MYMVYWTVTADTDEPTDAAAEAGPLSRAFDTNAMVDAMGFMEELRKRQRAGEGVRFITMCSEHPDVVGHPGVDVTGPGYDWKKRRR